MQTIENNTQKKTFPFGGILLVLAGLFMLLNQFVEIELSGGLFFGAIGLFFILWGATTRTAGLMVPAGILSGLSLGIFLVEEASIIPEAYQGAAFILSLGLGFALITLLSRIFCANTHGWALIVAAILGLVGAVIILLAMPNAGPLQQMVEATLTVSQYLWPLGLIALGVWIIFKRRDAQA